MKITGEVVGEKETAAAFSNLASKVSNDAVAATKSAAIVAGVAGSLAPVRTGFLAGSYGVQEQYVVSDASYAVYIEYGAPARNMAPQYIVQTAFENAAGQIEETYSQWIVSEAKTAGLEATASG